MTPFVGNANQEVRTQLTVSTAVPRNSGYSPIRCFEHVEPSSIIRGTTLAAKSPAFKGSGMKFGSAKKTKQAELLDAALGGEVLATTGLGVEERTEPTKPTQALSNQVHARVSPISPTHQHLNQSGLELQHHIAFKQHPNVAKFAPGAGPKVVALKDPGRAFLVGQSIAVLKWGQLLASASDDGLTTSWRINMSRYTTSSSLFPSRTSFLLFHPPPLLLSSPFSSDGSYSTISSEHTGPTASSTSMCTELHHEISTLDPTSLKQADYIDVSNYDRIYIHPSSAPYPALPPGTFRSMPSSCRIECDQIRSFDVDSPPEMVRHPEALKFLYQSS
ncbi:uncharacterized protein LACBIDRAFT_332213 [Laccaria bicolor S238N-H82]|uniref:Predicted protein n=1 Tax=Laccaria bicolor (strain S238N-H82 / ATCC MYA-4686) TaxID=486041 RepID=B0DRZ2_LACBS|nr:uncharacterized protein LACBIDRAFT_332213 [Laccaria bicolor S238N-H82]EDR02611.1 predicted protein [Laccaria bicolor S238N-H82]|eukprot:XP_001886655.1 predicted protein [Laccaria bicolor S238N-H82]